MNKSIKSLLSSFLLTLLLSSPVFSATTQVPAYSNHSDVFMPTPEMAGLKMEDDTVVRAAMIAHLCGSKAAELFMASVYGVSYLAGKAPRIPEAITIPAFGLAMLMTLRGHR